MLSRRKKNCCTGESPHKQRTFKPSRSRVFCNAEIRPIFPEYLISRSIFMFIYTIKYFTYLKGHSMANAPCSVLYLTNVSCIHVQIMSNKHSSYKEVIECNVHLLCCNDILFITFEQLWNKVSGILSTIADIADRLQKATVGISSLRLLLGGFLREFFL